MVSQQYLFKLPKTVYVSELAIHMKRKIYPTDLSYIGSVASRQKILLNNSEPAVEKNYLQIIIGGSTTAMFLRKSGQKICCVGKASL
jgi:hypothetical protein